MSQLAQDSDALSDASSSPSDPSEGLRSPHWTTGKEPRIGTASPLHTYPLLSKAKNYYKIFLLITYAFPELNSQRRHFAKDAWDAAHDELDADDMRSIKFTTDIESVVSLLFISTYNH